MNSNATRIRRIDAPTPASIAAEWDALAAYRAKQLDEGVDVSFSHVLAPTIETLLEYCSLENVVDIGSGTGHLTAIISRRAKRLMGIDISSKSIELAKAHFGNISSLTFEVGSPRTVARHVSAFSAAYSNMTLMDMPDIINQVTATAEMLNKGACFVFTISHPCFWPLYWGYAHAPWFNYLDEIAIRAPFKITNAASTDFQSTHFHRPLNFYCDVMRNAGFQIDLVKEPTPGHNVPGSYLAKWMYPRFLAMRCIKV